MKEEADITLDHIENAARRIRGVTVHTPLITNPELDAATGGRILIKPECLQRTGSFKFRGAYNRLVQLSEEERRSGVVAWSSGNHAQGIAAAAQLLDIPAAIVMPRDAPAVKVEKTKVYGAEIVWYDRYSESREQIGHDLAARRGAVLVPSYDDPHVMAGQGTAGLEIFRQASERGQTLDALLVCCGGGGLLAGIATAFASLSPGTDIYSVEPADFDDHARSLQSGTRERNTGDARSICDALLAPEPGELTFPINRRLLKGGLSVTDDEVRNAIRYAFTTLKLVIEPGGAVALAAVLHGKLDAGDKTVGVVVSGGNIDATHYCEILASG